MIHVTITGARGTAIRLDKFATNLPATTKRGRMDLAVRYRDYAIQDISQNRLTGRSRRGSAGLTNPSNWQFEETENSIRVFPMAMAPWEGTNWPYAEFVEYGTKPHWIENNPMWRNKMHPGARPNPFMKRAIERVRAESSPRFKELIRRSLQAEGLK